MALHLKKNHHELDDIFAKTSLATPLSRTIIPQEEQDPDATYQAIHDELMLDGNSRQNLATFCSTWLEPNVHKLMEECIDKNMIDKDEYPQTAEIENRCVSIIANLWNAKDKSDAVGCSTTGSSEAAMLGGLALKWRWREKMQSQGKDTSKPNLVCGAVQICWHKFARYWDVEIREIPMEEGRYTMSAEEMLTYCDENTIGVIPTLGLTFTGHYEDVEALSKALDGFEKRTGLDIPIHVDAASGGFVAPFCQPDIIWDFRLPRVKSINASGHKFGLSPLGCGWVIWSEKKDLPEDLIFNVNYLGGEMPTFALNFSRPGGEIVCQYYSLLRLGFEGYKKVQEASITTAIYFAKELQKMDIFTLVHDAKEGLPIICWKLKDEKNSPFTLFELSDKLRQNGWLVPAYTMPANIKHMVVQRIVVRHGVSVDLMYLLLEEIKKAIKELSAKNEVNMKPKQGFSHS